MKIGRWLPIAAAFAIVAIAAPVQAGDPDALRKIVIDQCATHQQARGNPAPCAAIDLAGGTAILKDRNGKTHFLVIPAIPVTGIESPLILAADAPNYWQAAWAARHLVEGLVGHAIPRDDIGLSINSAYGRSQNQLHIHVDCVRAEVRQALQANDGKIGTTWADLDIPLAGHRYRAMRLEGEELGARNPFKILADGDPQAASDMGRETLSVIGADFPSGNPGFYLLSDRAAATSMDMAASESLLDHDCRVLK